MIATKTFHKGCFRCHRCDADLLHPEVPFFQHTHNWEVMCTNCMRDSKNDKVPEGDCISDNIDAIVVPDVKQFAYVYTQVPGKLFMYRDAKQNDTKYLASKRHYFALARL